jgi:hypothetical protein
LLKGTASAVPKVLCLHAASAAEVCFLFREARFSADCSGVQKKVQERRACLRHAKKSLRNGRVCLQTCQKKVQEQKGIPSGVPKKAQERKGMPSARQKSAGTESIALRHAKKSKERKGIPSGVPKKGGGTEGHAFTRAINRRAAGPTALPKAGAKPKAKRLNLLPLPLPLFFFHRFLPKNRMSSPQTP